MITHKSLEIKGLNIECKATKIQVLEKMLDSLDNINELAKEYGIEINIENITAYGDTKCYVRDIDLKERDR